MAEYTAEIKQKRSNHVFTLSGSEEELKSAIEENFSRRDAGQAVLYADGKVKSVYPGNYPGAETIAHMTQSEQLDAAQMEIYTRTQECQELQERAIKLLTKEYKAEDIAEFAEARREVSECVQKMYAHCLAMENIVNGNSHYQKLGHAQLQQLEEQASIPLSYARMDANAISKYADAKTVSLDREFHKFKSAIGLLTSFGRKSYENADKIIAKFESKIDLGHIRDYEARESAPLYAAIHAIEKQLNAADKALHMDAKPSLGRTVSLIESGQHNVNTINKELSAINLNSEIAGMCLTYAKEIVAGNAEISRGLSQEQLQRLEEAYTPEIDSMQHNRSLIELAADTIKGNSFMAAAQAMDIRFSNNPHETIHHPSEERTALNAVINAYRNVEEEYRSPGQPLYTEARGRSAGPDISIENEQDAAQKMTQLYSETAKILQNIPNKGALHFDQQALESLSSLAKTAEIIVQKSGQAGLDADFAESLSKGADNLTRLSQSAETYAKNIDEKLFCLEEGYEYIAPSNMAKAEDFIAEMYQNFGQNSEYGTFAFEESRTPAAEVLQNDTAEREENGPGSGGTTQSDDTEIFDD